jgi:murein DD-endopeptidase MepM/ murein hydrolase activator NlpD
MKTPQRRGLLKHFVKAADSCNDERQRRMRRRSNHESEPMEPRAHARGYWMLAVAMVVVGFVPLAQFAKAVAPSECAGASYTVVNGDSWSMIASRSKVTMAALLTANAATTAVVIHPGQALCLPAGAVTTPAPAPAAGPTTTTTTTTTVPTSPAAPAPVVVALQAFPVQGRCGFADTFGAPRSGGRLHEGVDIIANAGKYVYAVTDGVLTRQYLDAPGSLSGNGWRLTAADSTYFFYAHLSIFAAGLQTGSPVKAGQIIGQVGMTGNAPIAHLHFEVHPAGGVAINPTPTVAAVNACKATEPLAQPGVAPALVPIPAPAAAAAPAAPAPAPAAVPQAVVVPAPALAPSPTPVAPLPPTVQSALLGGQNHWQFISSVVAVDTALAGKTLPAGMTRIRVSGLAGVPASSSAVLLRISTSDAIGGGYLLAHPCDAPLGSSTLNFSRSLRANGMAVVRVVDGSVCVTVSQPTKVRVEVIAVAGVSGVGPLPMATHRAIDTRDTGRPAPKAPISLSLDALGVSSGTQAVSVSITIVNPSKAGTVTVGACSGGSWNLAFSRVAIASYSLVVRINDGGLCLSSSVPADVLVDVNAAWVPDATIAPLDPQRVFDARAGSGTIGVTPEVIQVAGVGRTPADATVAMLNVTMLGGVGFVFACDQPRPSASTVSSSAGIISAAMVPVRLVNGAVCISTFAPVPVVVDVVAAG